MIDTIHFHVFGFVPPNFISLITQSSILQLHNLTVILDNDLTFVWMVKVDFPTWICIDMLWHNHRSAMIFRKKWHKSLQFKETTKLIKASSFHLIVCTEIDHPTWDRKLMALLSSILLLGFHLESPSWLGTRGTVTMCPSRKAAPESVNAIRTCKKFSTRCLLLWPQSQLWRASLGSSHWPNMKHVDREAHNNHGQQPATKIP